MCFSWGVRCSLSTWGSTSRGRGRETRRCLIRKTLPVLYSSITAVIQALIYVPAILFVAAYDHIGFVVFVFVVAFIAATMSELYWMHIALEDFDFIYILAMFHVTLRLIDFIVTGLFGGLSVRSFLLYAPSPCAGSSSRCWAPTFSLCAKTT